MKITNASVIVCSPGRNFVTLKIETDEGIYGLGDGTLNGRELAVVSYLTEHVIPCLIGRDPFQTEDIWQYLYRGAYWRRGPVTMSRHRRGRCGALGHQGQGAEYARSTTCSAARAVTASWSMRTPTARTSNRPSMLSAARSSVGYLAVSAQSGIPGLDSTYGVAKGNKPYEPAERGLPSESLWSTEKYLRHAPKLFERAARTASARMCICCTTAITG